MVVMNDEIHDAHSVYKSNTTEVSTFQSDEGLIGAVRAGALLPRALQPPHLRQRLQPRRSRDAAGVVSVRSSRVPTGLVGRMVEVDDDGLGFVASYGLSPPKARILLRLSLLTTSDPATIQQYFAEY